MGRQRAGEVADEAAKFSAKPGAFAGLFLLMGIVIIVSVSLYV
jgi:hypothetical protein